MLKVGFLPLFSVQRPSSRYRIFQFLQPLSEVGIQSKILAAPERNPWKRLLYLPRLTPIIIESDVLFVQKRLLPKLIMHTMERINPRILFDLDDAIFLRDQIREKVNMMLKSSSIIVAGNEYLANYARKYNQNVEVIPTVVDTNYYYPSPTISHRNKSKIVIGWIGIDPNRGDLERVKPVMEWLGKKFNGKVVFHIIGNHPLVFNSKLRVEFIPWRLASARNALQRFDIGLMPLDDTPWNRGKCGLKLIQYMAVGAATVASPVGVNKEITMDGQSGYLATTIEDWREKLARLIEDFDLRIQMGQQGRKRVEQLYSVKAGLPKLIEVLKQASSNNIHDEKPSRFFLRSNKD
ncbi:glycosyltransferase family 4 protein [Chloroflexota bacterium]